MAEYNESIIAVLFLSSIVAVLCNIVSVGVKLCKEFAHPKLWKYSLLYQNLASVCLSVGLILFSVDLSVHNEDVCSASGFFLLFGIVQCLFSHLTTGIILLSIQNPGKPSSISYFHRNICIVIVVPEIILGGVLSFLPFVSNGIFNKNVEYDVECFPLRDHGKQGAAYGTLLVVLWWLIVIAIIVCDVIIVLKLWKYNNRISTAQNNVWQTQLIVLGKSLIKFLVIEHFVIVCVLIATTLSVYVGSDIFKNSETWVVIISLAILSFIHGILSNIGDIMWTTCCCRDSGAVKEPHRKLKKLELLKIEARGKLRMKATWTVGKHATKRGLMKIYGVNHLKSWAQEIVMLGMLRKTQHPSLIQCLWTNSSNPYYETMTLISGEIITSDSRIICLELTNGGTLQDFLQKVELPLPEQYQRMIIHDVAEGLFYLHHENVLHNNLNSSCIYLKGSLQTRAYQTRPESMVLRAAVGDFEEAQIYGTLQQSLDASIKDKRYFFLPDIRSFALVALQIISTMSEKKFQNRYTNYSSGHVPAKINLANVIDDEDDEFEAQYCYDVDDTNRMFDSLRASHNAAFESDDEDDEEYGTRIKRSGSLDNRIDQSRPLSPQYHGRQSNTPETTYDSDDSYNGAQLSRRKGNVTYEFPASENFGFDSDSGSNRNKKEKAKTESKSLQNSRKSRKDMVRSRDKKAFSTDSKSTSSGSLNDKNDRARCLSPDPMQDEKLQELRKETKSESRKLNKKDRKFSFNRKHRSDENLHSKGKMEAFVKSGSDQEKRKEAKWSSKPTSILKSITSNDTTVSVFKAKQNDEESHLDAIEEEDISNNQHSFPKTRQVKVKEAKPAKAEVWDIIDEQYYTQVNKKATRNLKKTVSGESRSSLWSFISTPEDLDDDDLDDILDCLPGMTEPAEFRKPEITISDIIAERENATKREELKKKFRFSDYQKSKFELIDYLEMLKAKQITINDVPEEKREMLLNVVELKLEDKMKKGGFVETNVIRSDEMYDNNMSPNGMNTTINQKKKIVSFRKTPCSPTPQVNTSEQQRDPRLDRARSAPLKRPRTPMHKPQVQKPEVNPAFQDNRSISVAKRNKARANLKRALTNKAQFTANTPDRGLGLNKSTENIAVKYATIKKISAQSIENKENENIENDSEVLTVQIPTSEHFSVKSSAPKTVRDMKRYHSFSSNESASSIGSSIARPRPADVSLTSGELSSLSSQAESDHYETDAHMTDIETGSKSINPYKNKLINGPPSRGDSGFDSGSMSSEMSDPYTNRTFNANPHFHAGHSKGVVGSWARNYKMVESKTNQQYSVLPPVDSLPEDSVSDGSKSSVNTQTRDNTKTFNKNKNFTSDTKTKDLNGLNITPYTMVSSRSDDSLSRPMSPPSRMVSPVNRTLSPSGRPMSPEVCRTFSPTRQDSVSKSHPMSPRGASMSPNGRPLSARNTTILSTNRPMSPNARPMSPNSRPMSPASRPMSPNSRPMSPSSRPMSPNVLPTNNRNTKPFSPLNDYPQSNMKAAPFTPGRQLARPASPPKRIEYRTDPVPSIVTDTDTESVATSTNKSFDTESAVSKASKRYRELVKQGVPMRTSVIDASPTRIVEQREEDFRPGTADSTIDEGVNDQDLFENLEANGFFSSASRSRSPSPKKVVSPSRNRSPNNNANRGGNENKRDTKRKRKKHIPLEEIVRESPSNGNRKPKQAHRSASKNHLAVTDEAFLNQPTSEDSETCSVKTNKSNTSGTKPKMVVDAELVIDRIFSQNQGQDEELDVEVEAALGLDKDPFKAVNDMYIHNQGPETSNLNDIPLLNGVSKKHIHECMELASNLHVVTVRDLLPASNNNFEILRNKLQQVGQLGNVGNLLLDIIHKCWLQDMPPSSGDLVEQLTDPVTETEL
ncbi:hypothetical protein ACF0H5_002244 [Mactra antiquata]